MSAHCPRTFALVRLVGAEPQVAGRDPRVGVVGVELVAGQLLGEEPVVRLVGVERADDVIAIPPGVGPVGVGPVAVGFGVPDQVEPVPSPPLAVLGRGQQAVDQPLVGVGRVVGQKTVDLLGRRRQTRQIECDPADQGPPRRLGRGRQPVFKQLPEHKPIDRIPRPGRPFRGSGRTVELNLAKRLERPEIAVGQRVRR